MTLDQHLRKTAWSRWTFSKSSTRFPRVKAVAVNFGRSLGTVNNCSDQSWTFSFTHPCIGRWNWAKNCQYCCRWNCENVFSVGKNKWLSATVHCSRHFCYCWYIIICLRCVLEKQVRDIPWPWAGTCFCLKHRIRIRARYLLTMYN